MPSEEHKCLIYLLRHGSTEHNTAGRLMGHLDVPLAPQGELEAQAASATLQHRGISAIYASDLARAHSTALIVAARLGLTVQTRPGLREINMGVWAGHTSGETAELDPQGHAAVRADPVQGRPTGGESEREMAERVWRALAEIAAEHAGQTVLVVSHGGPLRSIVARVLGAPFLARGLFACANCGIMLLEWGPAGQRLVVPGPAV